MKNDEASAKLREIVERDRDHDDQRLEVPAEGDGEQRVDHQQSEDVGTQEAAEGPPLLALLALE